MESSIDDLSSGGTSSGPRTEEGAVRKVLTDALDLRLARVRDADESEQLQSFT